MNFSAGCISQLISVISSYNYFVMAKQGESSSNCSSGTNFGIDPNKRYIEKGKHHLIGRKEFTKETFTEDQFNPGVASSSLCTLHRHI